MNRLRMLLLLTLAWGATCQAQVPQGAAQRPVGTASVEGVVLRLGTNQTIAGADLELTLQAAEGGAGSFVYAAASGADGKFIFRNVPAGNFKLVAARIGGN